MPGSQSISKPQVFTFDPANVSLTGFASNVSGATWALTATSSGDGLAHQVSIRNDSGNDKSGIDITLVGTDANGNAQTETITGPGASATVESSLYYLTLTSVTPASTWGADTADIGWVDEFISATIPLNHLAEDIATLNVDVTGTINFTLRQTFDPLDGVVIRYQTVPGASSQTADAVFNTTGGATAVQVVVNSYTDTAEIRLNVNQTYVSNAPGAGSGGPTTDVNVAEWGGTATTLGQKAMAASVPVVLPTEQTLNNSVAVDDALFATSDLTSAVLNISTATTTAVVAAVSGQTTRVHRLRINVSAAQQITIANGASSLEVLNFTGPGFLVYDFSARPWYKTSANTALNFVTTQAVQVNGVVEYITSA